MYEFLFEHVFLFLGNIPRSETAESDGSPMLNILTTIYILTSNTRRGDYKRETIEERALNECLIRE